MAVKKGGLGRGLDSLFNENATDNNGAVTLRLTEIEPNKNQPRKDFQESTLVELAESIERHGLIQPIVVRPTAGGRYQIMAGERRWRACRMAGLDEVPVIIKEADDRAFMEIALIENLQREDLNAVEEALGYKTLMDTYGLTQEQISDSVGKSRSAVANALRLLKLKDEELSALKNGSISAGHARALLSVEDERLRAQMLTEALSGASVRELEKMAGSQKKEKASAKPKEKNTYYSEVEIAIKQSLHRKVDIKPTGKGRGKITIEFYSDSELADFARRLSGDDI